MLNQEQSQTQVHCKKDGRQYLPELTALVIEGLAYKTEDRQLCAFWPNSPSSGRSPRQQKAMKLLAAGETAASIPFDHEAIQSFANSEASGIETVQDDKLHIFLSGISNCFNDIIMGIWGNISLIHMHEKTPEAALDSIRQIEQLVQHGSVLIHIVFGYLAESRFEARHIRLNQLLQQIKEASLSNNGILDAKTIESFLRWTYSSRHPAYLSRSISRVLDNLLRWVAKKHRLVLSQAAGNDAIRARLSKIDGLIKRGFSLTEQLRQYAGDAPVVMRRMRIKSLIKHALKQLPPTRYGIRLETDLSIPLPDIAADRFQLSKALQHLLINAIDAMPKGGRLNIAAHVMSREQSHEKLLTRPGIDYLVITVSDSGKGMASRVQSRIFDPFYVDGRKPNHLGLGLSAANGIVKAHDGFIQVESSQGRGSTFRIFLPYSRKHDAAPRSCRKGACDSNLQCTRAVPAGCHS